MRRIARRTSSIGPRLVIEFVESQTGDRVARCAMRRRRRRFHQAVDLVPERRRSERGPRGAVRPALCGEGLTEDLTTSELVVVTEVLDQCDKQAGERAGAIKAGIAKPHLTGWDGNVAAGQGTHEHARTLLGTPYW